MSSAVPSSQSLPGYTLKVVNMAYEAKQIDMNEKERLIWRREGRQGGERQKRVIDESNQ